MPRPITDIDDPRLVKALAHPIRVRILGILEDRSATPRELATAIGVPLENVSYHVRTLRNFGLIELERTRQVRGAIEHHYRAAARPRITATYELHEQPFVAASQVLGEALERIGALASEGGGRAPGRGGGRGGARPPGV